MRKRDGVTLSVQWGTACFLTGKYHKPQRQRGWWGVCVIKRCLKSIIRKIYLFCNYGREKRGLCKNLGCFKHRGTVLRDFKAGEFGEHKSRRKKSSLFIFFIINPQNKLFFFNRARRGWKEGVVDFSFFSVFSSSLFSLFFNRCKNDWNPSRPHYCGPPESWGRA